MENTKKNDAVSGTELDAANREAATSADVYTHIFASPWEHEGQKYEKIDFDWGKLTGYDSLAIENEIQALGKALIAPEFSGDYLIRMAARASTPRIGADVIQAMPIGDFNKIRSRARSFLLKSAQ